MRKTIGTAALVVALATGGSALLGGTALAGVSPAPSVDNCVSYTLKKVNGKWVWVKTTGKCTSSSGSGGSGGSSGSTSTNGQQGTETNNCSSSSTCVADASGGTGTNH